MAPGRRVARAWVSAAFGALVSLLCLFMVLVRAAPPRISLTVVVFSCLSRTACQHACAWLSPHAQQLCRVLNLCVSRWRAVRWCWARRVAAQTQRRRFSLQRRGLARSCGSGTPVAGKVDHHRQTCISVSCANLITGLSTSMLARTRRRPCSAARQLCRARRVAASMQRRGFASQQSGCVCSLTATLLKRWLRTKHDPSGRCLRNCSLPRRRDPSVLLLRLTISPKVPRVSDERERGPRTTSDPFWNSERHILALHVHAARTPGLHFYLNLCLHLPLPRRALTSTRLTAQEQAFLAVFVDGHWPQMRKCHTARHLSPLCAPRGDEDGSLAWAFSVHRVSWRRLASHASFPISGTGLRRETLATRSVRLMGAASSARWAATGAHSAHRDTLEGDQSVFIGTIHGDGAAYDGHDSDLWFLAGGSLLVQCTVALGLGTLPYLVHDDAELFARVGSALQRSDTDGEQLVASARDCDHRLSLCRRVRPFSGVATCSSKLHLVAHVRSTSIFERLARRKCPGAVASRARVAAQPLRLGGCTVRNFVDLWSCGNAVSVLCLLCVSYGGRADRWLFFHVFWWKRGPLTWLNFFSAPI